MKRLTQPLAALGVVALALTLLVAADKPAPTPADLPSAPDAAATADPEAILEVKPATGHLPAGFQPSESLRDIVKMAQAGVSEDVLLTYIRGAGKAFHPSPEDIIFLNDLGVGEAVLKLLIDSRDVPTTAATPTAKPPASVLLSTNSPVTAAPAINGVVAQPAAGAPPAPPASAADSTTVVVTEPAPVTSVNYFYDSLAPYGSWINVSGYGWCWQPTVAVANVTWRPYCDNGRWVYSNYGWYWHSGYSWGWAPFHYGRWYNHGTCGWLWQPDTVWSASWVSWRYSSQYCGWAPLPPAAYYRPGFGFSYYNGNVSVGIGFDFGLSYYHYNYVPVNQFCAPNPRHHVAHHNNVQAIHNHTTVVNNYVTGDNNTVINHGIGRDRITRGGRTPIPEVTVRDAVVRTGAPGATTRIDREGGRDVVYRPVLGRPNLAGPDRSDRRVPGASSTTAGPVAPVTPAQVTPAPATASSTTPPGRTPPAGSPGSPRTTRPTPPTPAPTGTPPSTAAASSTAPVRSGAPGAAPGSAIGRDENRSERVNQLIEEARRQSVSRNSRGPGSPAAPVATAPVTTAPVTTAPVAGATVGASGGASPTPAGTRTPPGRTPPRSAAPTPAPTPAPTVVATPQPVVPQVAQPSVQPRTQSPRLTQERVTELVREMQRQREQPRSAPAPAQAQAPSTSVNVTPRPTPQPIQRQNSYTPPAPAPAPTPSVPVQSQRPPSGYVPTRELPPSFDRSRITAQPNSGGRSPVSPAPAPAPAPAPVTRSAPPAPAPSGGGSVSGGSSRAVESRGNVQRGGSQGSRGRGGEDR